VDDECGNGRGSCKVELWLNSAEVTDMHTAGTWEVGDV